MQLKRTNQLIPLLRRHLAATSISYNRLEEKQLPNIYTIDLSLSNKPLDNQNENTICIELF
jgi:hypothetical protein